MYCPICGEELTVHNAVSDERKEILSAMLTESEGLGLSDKEYDEMCGIDPYYGKALLCYCPNGHFGKDFPLIYHHPVYGLKSAPGDSFALSWIK